MRKILLMCLLFGNCISWSNKDYPLASKPDMKNIVKLQLEIFDKSDERRWNTYAVFNKDNLFDIKDYADVRVSIDCDTNKEPMSTMDMVIVNLAIFSGGVFPLYLSKNQLYSVKTYYKKKQIRDYVYQNHYHELGSIFLFPMLLFKPTDKQFENFLVNTGREIYSSIESDIAQIEKQEQEEKEAATKIEEEKKLAEEMKLKEEKEKADAEYKEELAKIKSLKPTILPVGALYCKQEMYAVGISMGATTQETIMALLSIKECVQVEDKPIKAKIVPSQSQYATVYVYINDEKFYSTKRMLRSR